MTEDPSAARPTRPFRAAIVLAALALWLPGAAAALDAGAVLPAGAMPGAERQERNTTVGLPLDVWDGRTVPMRAAEGKAVTRAWRIPGADLTTLDVMAPIRAALEGAGYDVLLDCQTRACGGFDFRFALPVLPEPGMHVDLGDFRWLTAEKPVPGGTETVGVLVSRSSNAAFVQIVTVSPADPAPARDAPAAATATGAATGAGDPAAGGGAGVPGVPGGADGPDGAGGAAVAGGAAGPGGAAAADGAAGLAEALERDGRAVLDDLVFEPGSAALGEGEFASLAALAAYLAANPEAGITLVGHTDRDGSLAANIALSKRRAASVADRLAGRYGIDRARIGAEGVGFLAPRATNLTPEGRALNRRVEVVLTAGG